MEAAAGTVLIVDDEPSIRLLCRVNLELAGWRVVEAGDVAEARERVQGEPVDVVLLDIHLGHEDGLALLSELKEDHPSLPIALFSGTAEVAPADAERADAVVPKPFPLEVLTSTVTDLAGRHDGAR